MNSKRSDKDTSVRLFPKNYFKERAKKEMDTPSYSFLLNQEKKSNGFKSKPGKVKNESTVMAESYSDDRPFLTEQDVEMIEKITNRSRVQSVGSNRSPNNPFSLDTRGASKAIGHLAKKKEDKSDNKKLADIASKLLERIEKNYKAERKKEIQDDALKAKERYFEAGLRYISNGDKEKAEEYLRRAGLTIDEVQEELQPQNNERLPEATKKGSEGPSMDSEIQRSENPNSRLNSEPVEQEVKRGNPKQVSGHPEEYSQGQNDNTVKKDPSNNESMFIIQEALGNMFLKDEDVKTKEILKEGWIENNSEMLKAHGIPESELDRLSEIMFEDMLKRKTANAQPQKTKFENRSEKGVTDSVSLDWLEGKLNDIEESDSSSTDGLKNLRLEIQDMRSSGNF